MHGQKKKALGPSLSATGRAFLYFHFNIITVKVNYFFERSISSWCFVMTSNLLKSGFVLKCISSCERHWLSGSLIHRRLTMTLCDCVSAFRMFCSMVLLLLPSGHLISHSIPSISISGRFCLGIELGQIISMELNNVYIGTTYSFCLRICTCIVHFIIFPKK